MFTLDRASMWKRISAWLLDAIIIAILATGFAFLISWITNYDSYWEKYEEKYDEYQTTYETDFGYTKEEYDALDEAEQEKYNKAYEAFSTDEEVLYNWNMMINLTLIMVSVGLLLAILISEFIVPLFIKNGQTVGKLCFSICLVRSDCVKISNLMLFTRAILGKFAIESIIPIYVVILMFFGNGGRLWLIIAALILVVQFVLLFFTRNHTPIHDLLSGTVVVDKSSQKIYYSTEELVKAKEEYAKEEASKANY